MGRLISDRIREPKAYAFYDVSGTVRSWGRRGVLWGGIFGFALGAAFVAIPFTSDVLTFGIIGTLIVAAVEGAVIAGAVSVCIAAFCGKGERYSSARTPSVCDAEGHILSWTAPPILRGEISPPDPAEKETQA